MNKIDSFIASSCELLKQQQQITYEDYQKCKNVIDGSSSVEPSLFENTGIFKQLEETPEKTSVYDNLKKETDIILNRKNDINYSTDLNNLKKEIIQHIKKYETKINDSSSKQVYKDMIMKHKSMLKKMNSIEKQNNKLLTIDQKNNSIKASVDMNILYFKIYLGILVLSIITLYYIQFNK